MDYQQKFWEYGCLTVIFLEILYNKLMQLIFSIGITSQSYHNAFINRFMVTAQSYSL